jgi:hypothetical protein
MTRSHIMTDSQPASQSVSLGVRRPSGACDQFFFLLEIFFRQLRVCYFVAPSLTRGRVRVVSSLYNFEVDQVEITVSTNVVYALLWKSDPLSHSGSLLWIHESPSAVMSQCVYIICKPVIVDMLRETPDAVLWVWTHRIILKYIQPLSIKLLDLFNILA